MWQIFEKGFRSLMHTQLCMCVCVGWGCLWQESRSHSSDILPMTMLLNRTDYPSSTKLLLIIPKFFISTELYYNQNLPLTSATRVRNPDQSIWDLLWTKWHWSRFFSDYFAFALSALLHYSAALVHPSLTLYNFSKEQITRWFKYARDYLCVNKSQFVPVIFEPPCNYHHLANACASL
jgi:hypothetical protein